MVLYKAQAPLIPSIGTDHWFMVDNVSGSSSPRTRFWVSIALRPSIWPPEIGSRRGMSKPVVPRSSTCGDALLQASPSNIPSLPGRVSLPREIARHYSNTMRLSTSMLSCWCRVVSCNECRLQDMARVRKMSPPHEPVVVLMSHDSGKPLPDA